VIARHETGDWRRSIKGIQRPNWRRDLLYDVLPIVLATRLFFVALTVLVIGLGVPLWQTLADNAPPIFVAHDHVTGTALDAWNRSDVQWYDDLARLGYNLRGPDSYKNVAFFPLFPLLVRTLHLALSVAARDVFGLASADDGSYPPYIVAGMLVSNLCATGALMFFYGLVRLDHGRDVARRAVLLLALSPLSLFLVAAYSEGTFLLCATAFFYTLRLERWWQAGLWGLLAALARPPGMVLLAPFLMAWVQTHPAVSRPVTLWLRRAWDRLRARLPLPASPPAAGQPSLPSRAARRIGPPTAPTVGPALPAMGEESKGDHPSAGQGVTAVWERGRPLALLARLRLEGLIRGPAALPARAVLQLETGERHRRPDTFYAGDPAPTLPPLAVTMVLPAPVDERPTETAAEGSARRLIPVPARVPSRDVWRSLYHAVPAVAIPLGLGLFMAFLYVVFGDPLWFSRAEHAWWRTFAPPWQTLYVSVVWPLGDALRGALDTDDFYGLHDLCYTVTGLVLTFYAWRRLPRVQGVYLWLLWGVLLSTPAMLVGQHEVLPHHDVLMSMPRMMLMMFPLCTYLALKKRLFIPLAVLFTIGLTIYSVMFITNIWVS